MFLYMALLDNEEISPFEALYKKYKNKVYRICYKVLRDKNLADDATVEVFFAIAKNFKIVKNLEHHKLDTYIVITSRNRALNMLKKEKNSRETLPYDDDKMFTDTHMKRYDYVFLKECIAQLTDNELEVLMLRTSQGLEYKQIATALGISEATARKRMQYARKHLAELLRMETGGHDQ